MVNIQPFLAREEKIFFILYKKPLT